MTTASPSLTDPSLGSPKHSAVSSKFNKRPGRLANGIFAAVLTIGTVYAGSQLVNDLSRVRSPSIAGVFR